MGFAYKESMWDDMYAAAGGYDAWSKSGTVISTSDGVNYDIRPTSEAEYAAAAQMPSISLDQWNEKAQATDQATINAGNDLAQQRIEQGITQIGIPTPVSITPNPLYEYRSQTGQLLTQSTTALAPEDIPQYSRQDVKGLVAILKGVNLPGFESENPEFSENDILGLVLYLKR